MVTILLQPVRMGNLRFLCKLWLTTTVWFSYTPTESHYVTAQMLNESYYAYVACLYWDTLATWLGALHR